VNRIKIVCECGYDKVDVMSAREESIIFDRRKIPMVSITYICPNCGCMKEDKHYLYKENIND